MITRRVRHTMIAVLAAASIATGSASPSHVMLDAGGGAAPATSAAIAAAALVRAQVFALGAQRLTEFDDHPHWRGPVPAVAHAAARSER